MPKIESPTECTAGSEAVLVTTTRERFAKAGVNDFVSFELKPDITKSVLPCCPCANIRAICSVRVLLEQVDQRSEQFIDDLVDRYDIIVEPTEVPMTVSSAGTRE